MLRSAVTILLFISLLGNISAQTLTFDVVKGNKNLGTMKVSRTVDGATEEIEFESDVTFRVLLSFRIVVTQYEKFRNAHLNWGKSLNLLNGRTQKDTRIVANEKGYLLTLDGVNVQLTEPIEYSVSQIYFTEPRDGQRVFSQTFAQFFHFKKVADHKYQLSSPDGDNYYTYTNGICTEVRVERDFANFNFVIQPNYMKAVKSKADSLYMKIKKL